MILWKKGRREQRWSKDRCQYGENKADSVLLLWWDIISTTTGTSRQLSTSEFWKYLTNTGNGNFSKPRWWTRITPNICWKPQLGFSREAAITGMEIDISSTRRKRSISSSSWDAVEGWVGDLSFLARTEISITGLVCALGRLTS